MIRAIAIWLLCWTVANGQYLVEQPQDAKPNLGQAIGDGAAVVYSVHTDEFLAEARKVLEDEEKETALNNRLGRPPRTNAAIGLAVLAVDRKHLIKRLEAEQEEVRRLTGENEALRAQLRQRDSQVEPVKETRLKFTMVTATDCEACPAKLAIVRPWAERAGYLFDNENHIKMRGGTYPRYRVCYGEYCEEFNTPVERLGDAVAERLRRWGVSFTR